MREVQPKCGEAKRLAEQGTLVGQSHETGSQFLTGTACATSSFGTLTRASTTAHPAAGTAHVLSGPAGKTASACGFPPQSGTHCRPVRARSHAVVTSFPAGIVVELLSDHHSTYVSSSQYP